MTTTLSFSPTVGVGHVEKLRVCVDRHSFVQIVRQPLDERRPIVRRSPVEDFENVKRLGNGELACLVFSEVCAEAEAKLERHVVENDLLQCLFVSLFAHNPSYFGVAHG
jgi:hypothetical protein